MDNLIWYKMTTSTLTKFSQFSNFQDIFVELVIVSDWEDDLIETFQLFDIVHCDVTQIRTTSANKHNQHNQTIVGK